MCNYFYSVMISVVCSFPFYLLIRVHLILLCFSMVQGGREGFFDSIRPSGSSHKVTGESNRNTILAFIQRLGVECGGGVPILKIWNDINILGNFVIVISYLFLYFLSSTISLSLSLFIPPNAIVIFIFYMEKSYFK